MALLPHQERVVIEKTELDDKIARLTLFIEGPLFNKLTCDECTRLARQKVAMLDYSRILGSRIEAFTA